MWDYFWKVFAILFIAVGPLENAAVYAGIAHNYTKKELSTMAYRSCILAGIVLVVFSVGGNFLLRLVGLQLYSLQVGGGVLLMIVAIKMVMEDSSFKMSPSDYQSHRDLSVFPLAIPLIAGPATITQATLLMGAARDETYKQMAVLLGILALMIISYILLRVAGWITRSIGAKGAEMFTRVIGILLAALAANLIIEGIIGAKLFG